jgi:hypothetical protein
MTLLFDGLLFFDNYGDSYTVLVWADGCKKAGFVPVYLSNRFTRQLDLMLVETIRVLALRMLNGRRVRPHIPSLDQILTMLLGSHGMTISLRRRSPLLAS